LTAATQSLRPLHSRTKRPTGLHAIPLPCSRPIAERTLLHFFARAFASLSQTTFEPLALRLTFLHLAGLIPASHPCTRHGGSGSLRIASRFALLHPSHATHFSTTWRIRFSIASRWLHQPVGPSGPGLGSEATRPRAVPPAGKILRLAYPLHHPWRKGLELLRNR
jgi:hypothetical protein